MTVTLVIAGSFLLGAVLSRIADRIEANFKQRRDDLRWAAFNRNHISKPYDRSGR